MIKLRIDDNIYEITQEVADGYINVDVMDLDGNHEYYFDLDINELAGFLYKYQKDENII